MEAKDAERALGAAMAVAAALDLAADDAVILNDSNRLVALLLPCRAVARVSPTGWFSAAREVEVVRRLAEADGPVAGLDARVEPRVVGCDGFEIALWAYFEPAPARELPPSDYAHTLERLHGALRRVDLSAPHFTDRLAEVRRWLVDAGSTPDLSDQDRELLIERLETPTRLLTDSGATEQLLHGEPHPWNVLTTANNGLLFIDFENCARGPIEYDLAWVPSAVSERYRDAHQRLVGECRRLVLALVAAHRWRRDDQHPSGRQSGVAFLDVLREGPPWPALDAVRW
jgi:hypothetical protein